MTAQAIQRIAARVPGGWRLPVLAALLLAWWNPSWHQVALPAQVFVLVDGSVTIDQDDLQQQWGRIGSALEGLPQGSRYSIYQVSDSQPAASELLVSNGAMSELSDTARVPQAIHQPEGQDAHRHLINSLAKADAEDTTPTLVLLSDDKSEYSNGWQLLTRLRQQGYTKQYRVNVANSTLAAGLNLSGLEIPHWASPGSSIPWQLSLISPIDQSAALQVHFNGRLVTSHQLQLQAGLEHHANGLVATDPTDNSVSAPLQIRVITASGELQLQHLVNFSGIRNALYVSPVGAAGSENVPAVIRTLRELGWQIRMISPAQLAALLGEQVSTQVVVLDNVAIEDMADTAWQQLLQRVRFDGTGLITLGGSRAFGAGGYRHSTLESALPVTAEPSQPKRPAAVQFVVDRSGSMDAEVAGKRRMEYAREAILSSAALLQTTDAIGVLGFADETEEWLPLSTYAEPRKSILGHWSSAVGGATNLAPALSRSIDSLATSSLQQRLLVLVTDGFTQTVDTDAITQQLAKHQIDLIALSIGDNANLEVLRALTSNSGSKLLAVARASQLPQLMRNNVALQRLALEQRDVQPVLVQTPPMMLQADVQWPLLSGFASTRAREGSTVYLSTVEGDPLLAARRYGLGNVIALPAGLDQFATAWPQWQHWPALVRGLMQWANRSAVQSRIHLQLVQSGAGETVLHANVVTTSGEWDLNPALEATLVTPANELVPLALQPTAPGSYTARLPLDAAGEYDISVIGAQGANAVLKFDHNQIQQAIHQTIPLAAAGTRSDATTVANWPADKKQVEQDLVMHTQKPTQTLWLVLGLGFFIGGLLIEARLDLKPLIDVVRTAFLKMKSVVTSVVTGQNKQIQNQDSDANLLNYSQSGVKI